MDYILYVFHPPCTKVGIHEDRDKQILAIKELSITQMFPSKISKNVWICVLNCQLSHQSDLTSPLGPEAQNSHRHLCCGMQSISQHQSSFVNLSLAVPLQIYLLPCPEAGAHMCSQSWT